MSDAEGPKREDKVSQTNDPVLVQTVSFVKVTQTPDSQPITINFYASNLSPKIDKPVQTDSSCTVIVRRSSSNLQNRIQQSESQELRNQELRNQELRNQELRNQELRNQEIRNQELRNQELRNKELRNQELKSREIGNKDFSLGVYRKIRVPFHETWRPRFMNSRKFVDNKAAAASRAASDLERKRLEAEYKAAEELAKIQKSVIEKRLALELASLEDSDGTPYRPVSQNKQQPQFSEDELRVLEELKKKTKLMSQMNEPVPKKESPRMLLPGLLQPTKTGLNESPIISRADSCGPKQNPSESNPLRHLFEKKLNLDIKSQSKPSFPVRISPSSSQERECNEFPVDVKSSSNDIFDYEPDEPDEPSCSPESLKRLRTRNMWQVAFDYLGKKIDEYEARKKAEKAARERMGVKKSKRIFGKWKTKKNKAPVAGGRKKRPDLDGPGAGRKSIGVVMTP